MNIPARNANFQLLMTTTEQLVKEKGCREATLKDIMERSGLSKGAIYHYVRSKDELLGLVLQECLVTINESFLTALSQGNPKLEEPLQVIARELRNMLYENDVSVRIFIYLLSQANKPEISVILRNLYENMIKASTSWIESGQQGGVIASSIDSQKTAEMLVMLSYGMQVRYSISPGSSFFTSEDYYEFMLRTLSQ